MRKWDVALVGPNLKQDLQNRRCFVKVQKFIEFPKAHPYFPSLLSSVEKKASELLRTDLAELVL